MSLEVIELTEKMKQDRKNCNEDLCANDHCNLWMEAAECCLLELIQENESAIKLPCKKGDIVYDLVLCNDQKWHVFEMKVCAINPFGDTRNGKTWNVYLECTTEASMSYRSFYDFGRTVFFSQEEAENKKKEMESEKNEQKSQP